VDYCIPYITSIHIFIFKKNYKIIQKEYKKLFFLGAMGCGVCGAFPFLAGQTTTVANMGIIYTSSPIFIILISALFFKEKITLTKVIGLVACLIGVFAIIIKGDLELLINLKFTIGDLWMLAAAIGWALYSIYLFYWKTELEIFQRFTLVAFFGAVSLFPFYIGEEIYFQRTVFNNEFLFMDYICCCFTRNYSIYIVYVSSKTIGRFFDWIYALYFYSLCSNLWVHSF
jgi:drug/metabolite transporter (DMT)-like permease